MDIADVFLALSKMLNYLQLQRTSEIAFAFFLCVWTYFRHYQNLRILWSVWVEYDQYVPMEARHFRPWDGIALSGWMRYQVFAPLLALQAINLFWYALMWRIVLRCAGISFSHSRLLMPPPHLGFSRAQMRLIPGRRTMSTNRMTKQRANRQLLDDGA
jgi:hypothetical protein